MALRQLIARNCARVQEGIYRERRHEASTLVICPEAARGRAIAGGEIWYRGRREGMRSRNARSAERMVNNLEGRGREQEGVIELVSAMCDVV